MNWTQVRRKKKKRQEDGIWGLLFPTIADWSENYSPQPEIYAYLRRVAKKYDVYKNLQLNTTVLKLEWIPDMNQWKVDYCHKDHPEQVQSKHYDLV
jgi:cation diffusion facilitator CzcD-associated flavoprotein CzcO